MGWPPTPVIISDLSPLLLGDQLLQPAKSLFQFADPGFGFLGAAAFGLDALLNTLLDALLDALECPNLAKSRISRSLLHILLDLRQEDADRCKEYGTLPYIRLLGKKKDLAPGTPQKKLKKLGIPPAAHPFYLYAGLSRSGKALSGF